MKKRVWGIVLTILGVLLLIFPTLTILNTVKVMPRPDPAEIGTSIVTISRYYDLRMSFLLMAVGVVLLLGALALFLSPVRRKAPIPVIAPEPVAVEDGTVATPVFGGEGVAAPIPTGAPMPVFASEEARLAYEAEFAAAGATVSVAAEAAAEAAPVINIPRKKTVYAKSSQDGLLVPECYLRTRLTGTTFVGGNTADQSFLSALTKGDRVVFRDLRRRQVEDTIGVYSEKGKQLGFLDVTFVRALRAQYPDHSIDARVERIGGGNGLPYTCDLRVVVYRT